MILKVIGAGLWKFAERFYHNSGLCYGFTEIFKRHAEWETALWKSIVDWQPSGGSSEEEFSKLNDHLEKSINWASGDSDARAL